MENNIIKKFSIGVRIGQIEAGPPLSTILGNMGINTVNFCKELNDFVLDLPNFFYLEIKVVIFFDKTYSFEVGEPSTALLLRLLSKKIELKDKSIIYGIKLEDIYLISFFKFNNFNNNSLKIIFGTLSSLKLHVIE